MRLDKHVSLAFGFWEFESYPSSVLSRRPLDSIDALHRENLENPRKTVLPERRTTALNIITTDGLTEMAKRDADLSTSKNAYHAIGTGTDKEEITDTSLETEVARREIGHKSQVNTQVKYRTAFTDADFSAASHDITEAGIFTASVGGICMTHVTTSTPVLLDANNTLLVSFTLTRENGAV